MRIPRDLGGRELAVALRRESGYEITRQRGSHIRVSTVAGGEHHLTLPDHSPLRVGTLSSILNEVANHFQLSRQEVEERLFRK